MAIIFLNAPEDGRQFAYKLLSELLQADSNAFKGPQLKDLTITNSLPMYFVGPKDIIFGKLLASAKLGGWRYLVMHGTNLIAEIPLNISPSDGTIIKAGGIMMDCHNRLIQGLRKAEDLPQIQKQNYEFRWLRCSPIYFSAIWLRAKTEDVIIPLPFTYGRMDAYRSYSEVEIIKKLESAAKENLATALNNNAGK